MSLEFPTQNRAIDPFSSYNSNVVNVLTRMITRGKNCLHGVHAIDVVIDATCSNTEITILPGECFKDDVLIQILESKTVDMTLADYYINHNNPWTEAGYYYVTLEYTYQKAKPAPVAKIRILKPSQRALYDEDTSPFLLLKIVEVVFDAGIGTFVVNGLTDYDPSEPNNKRVYSQLYAGVEDSLPVFDKIRDEGRIVYVHDRDELFFGIDNRWESFNAVRANIDTSLCNDGELIYIDEYGQAQLAISTSPDTLACGIVLYSGTNDGKIRLFGEFENVKVEPGISITTGDHLYLSPNVAGTITNLIPSTNSQYIGIAISNSTIDDKCNILFLPGKNGAGNNSLNNIFDFYQDLLHASIFEYIFIEPFGNNDFIDSTNSNIQINNVDYSLTGGDGDYMQSISLQRSSFSGQMHVAQITANQECSGSTNINWYISNNGSEPLDWEKTELDQLHHFSSYRLEFSSVTGTFQIGENVLSSTTNKMATINGINSGRILVFGDTRHGLDYVIGETITGQTSGATGVISNVVNRQLTTYHDLRVKIEFTGTPGECKVFDYGVLYDQDEDIFNFMPSEADIQANLDTIYLDVYRYPSQDNDGNANLSEPLEVQIDNLRDFVDSTCCVRLSQVESDIDNINNEITDIQNNIDTTSVSILINQVNELNNDIDTLYNDIYETPHRDNDGNPNRSESIEETLNDLQSQITALGGGNGVRSAMFITTADSTPDVQDNPSIVRVDYSSPLTITNFTNGTIGQEVIIVFTNSNTTIQHNANIHLMGDIDFESENEYILSLIYNGSVWIEKSRNITTFA